MDMIFNLYKHLPTLYVEGFDPFDDYTLYMIHHHTTTDTPQPS